ncbi:hypothetical protein [Paenibacillus sp. FSL K6-0108]|uniref:hypothetical protein n=1 Tax=Paenibacillus sp. FSL K6-0108 TaxID=2921417 RepID=UPI0032567D5E
MNPSFRIRRFQSRLKQRAPIPLEAFIEGVITLLGTEADEILVEETKMMRNNQGPNEGAFVTQVNDMMTQAPTDH